MADNMEDLNKELSKQEEDIFIGLDKDPNPLGREAIHASLGPLEEDAPKTNKWTSPLFKRSATVQKEADSVKAQQTPEKIKETNEERLAALEAELMRLRAMQDIKVEQKPSKPPVIDFSKLSETDVFDLDIPIEAIQVDLPDTSPIPLKDPHYVGRWVVVHALRLGPLRAAGFTYVTKEDLDGEFLMDLQEDENGHYRWIDVVAMKAPKAKYFAALRANHLRAVAQTNPKKVHELARRVTEQAIMNGTSQTKAPIGQSTEYQKRKEAGQIGIYSPNF